MVLKADGTYAHTTAATDNPTFTDDETFAVKFVGKGTAVIGGKKVAVESKQIMLDKTIAKWQAETSEAMRAFAAEDEAVKLLLAKERQAGAEAFVDEIASEEQAAEDAITWQTKLSLNKDGTVANTLNNVSLILANDPQLKHIRFNLLSDGMEKCGAVPWHSPKRYRRDADDAQLLAYLDRTYGQFNKTFCETAITKAADDRAYHPIRDYLNGLPPWDGVPRLDTLLVDYLGAVDSSYVRKVTRLISVAAVNRVFMPVQSLIPCW